MPQRTLLGFIALGAAGFGAGGAIVALSLLVVNLLPVSVLIGGAIGGASLGLVLRDRRKALVLTLSGALGLGVGIFTTLAAGSYLDYSSVLMGALVGAVVGTSLGVAIVDWRAILGLAVAGAAGFGFGLLAGDLLRALFPVVGAVGSITVAGLVGGASLGATDGYLEGLEGRRASR